MSLMRVLRRLRERAICRSSFAPSSLSGRLFSASTCGFVSRLGSARLGSAWTWPTPSPMDSLTCNNDSPSRLPRSRPISHLLWPTSTRSNAISGREGGTRRPSNSPLTPTGADTHNGRLKIIARERTCNHSDRSRPLAWGRRRRRRATANYVCRLGAAQQNQLTRLSHTRR